MHPSPFRLPYTLQQWLDMRRSNANVFGRVRIALAFFQRNFRYTPDRLLSELVCHDFSLPVFVGPIKAGTELVGYKNAGANPREGSYFAPVGTPPDRLGIGWLGRGSGGAGPKVFHRYRVVTDVPEALFSTANPARDVWSDPTLPRGQLAAGAGSQRVIPNAAAFLA